MSEEETKKMEYINENIIEKGYNIEDIASYAINKTGSPFESLSLEKLKEVVEEYKDQGLTDTYKSIKEFEKKEKEKEKIKEQKEKEQKEKEQKEKEQKEKEDKEKQQKEKQQKERQQKEKQQKEKEEKEQKEKKNQEKEKVEKINVKNILYSQETYDIPTDIQQENKLMELCRNNNKLEITISTLKRETKQGILNTKTILSYKIDCPLLKSSEWRTFSDFEWFRQQLVIRYPLRIIPPLLKESEFKAMLNSVQSEDTNFMGRRVGRYLQNFINGLLKKKIFKTSPILYEFLVLNADTFKKYQNKLNSKKYELDFGLKNLITMKGKIKCEIKEDSVDEASKLFDKYNIFADTFKKIDIMTSNIAVDLDNLRSHTEQLSQLFNKLNEKKLENFEESQNIFENFENIFKNWSKTVKKQSQYFNTHFRENFNFLGHELSGMDLIFKKFSDFKNEYETYTFMILKKKEELYSSKNIKKWNVKPGTEADIPNFINNKKLAFEKMLYKESVLLKEEKKRICGTIHIMNKQFNKIVKIQNEKIKTFYDSVIKNAKMIFGNEQLFQEFLVKEEPPKAEEPTKKEEEIKKEET